MNLANSFVVTRRQRSVRHISLVLCCSAVFSMWNIMQLLQPQHVLVHAFAPQSLRQSTQMNEIKNYSISFRRQLSKMHEIKNDNILDRFVNPKIQDPALPLTEAGIVQIVAPTFQLLWLRSVQSPLPTWSAPLYDTTFVLPRGYLLAPTLIHGAALACCWILGCLAARGFEQDAYEGDLKTVLFSTARAGAFACGVLILATQIDLYQELGGYVQFGESVETDFRIYQAFSDIGRDIFFEAIVLFSWRAFRSKVPSL